MLPERQKKRSIVGKREQEEREGETTLDTCMAGKMGEGYIPADLVFRL